MKIILGSSSERRKEILNFFSLPFIKVDSTFNENTISKELSPAKYTQKIAKGKAIDIALKYPNDLIITADIVVYFEKSYLLKPKNLTEASKMLKRLSGKEHEVYTGLCIKTPQKTLVKSEKTKVFFKVLTDQKIALYLKHLNCLDKAGSYSVQKGGNILIKKINGCFYNVMGLPINLLSELLQKAGIDLWTYLKDV